jgi:hypothetical protein
MLRSAAQRQAEAVYLARNIDKVRALKLAYYHAHGDELRSKQRERYHVKKAQRLAAERQVRILEEAQVELNAMYGFEVPRATQISDSSL